MMMMAMAMGANESAAIKLIKVDDGESSDNNSSSSGRNGEKKTFV